MYILFHNRTSQSIAFEAEVTAEAARVSLTSSSLVTATPGCYNMLLQHAAQSELVTATPGCYTVQHHATPSAIKYTMLHKVHLLLQLKNSTQNTLFDTALLYVS